MPESVGTAYVRVLADGSGLGDGIEDAFKDNDKAMKRAGDRDGRSYSKSFARAFSDNADQFGRFFGRGSRNNFLNFFGSMVTNSLKATGFVIENFGKMIEAVFDFGKAAGGVLNDVRQKFSDATGAAAKFGVILGASGLEGAFATAVTGGLNFVVGLGALIAAMGVAAISAGVLISALVLLTGVVIALAGAIYASLIAAVAALIPLLVPLSGIVAGVVAAVFLFKDATKELKAPIRDVQREANKLADAFKSKAFKDAPALVQRIADSMKGLDKFAASAGEGFNNFAKAMVRSITGPEFKAFTDTFTNFLPSASRKLGIIFGNVFEGLGGLMRAAIPLANQLLNWLVKITESFSEWANSKQGQEDIKNFLRDAADSAKSVGRFLKEAGGLIQDFLLAGQGTGNTLFDDMADALSRIRTFFKENPDAMENFFADAKGFAESLGGAVTKIADALDRIDTPESRKAANFLVEAFGAAAGAAAFLIVSYQQVASALISIFKNMALVIIGAFRLIIDGALKLASGVIDALALIPGPAGKAARAMQGSFQAASDKVTSDFDEIEDAINQLEIAGNAFNPTLDVNTAPAVSKLNFLATLIAQIQRAINNANSTPMRSPNAVDHSSSQGGIPTGSEEGAPNGSRTTRPRGSGSIQINVTTPTVDPRAVAAETVNRLVAMGY